MNSYNLVDRPWLPCTMSDHERRDLGLREVLVGAHEVQEVVGDNPLVTVSILRLLIAALHRILEGPETLEDWERLWSAGRFDEGRITAYLEQWKGRFDLLDPDNPFFQVGAFTIVDKHRAPKPPNTIAALGHELSSGNNALLFDHTVEGKPFGFSRAEAARRLLAHQFYAIGGGKGGTSNRFGEHPYLSHGPLVGGVVLMPKGKNLFETLTLNLLVPNFHKAGTSPEDRPVWEWEDLATPGTFVPFGYLSALTAPSRYCRLTFQETELGAVDKGSDLTGIHTAQALAIKDGFSPWMALRPLKDGTLVPLGMSVDRMLWRDAHVFFSVPNENEDRNVDGRPPVIRQAETVIRRAHVKPEFVVEAYGLANDKAKLLAWRKEVFDVPTSVLTGAHLRFLLNDAIARAEEVGRRITGDLYRTAKLSVLGNPDRMAKGAEKDKLQLAMEPNSFWSRMNEPFRKFLEQLPEDGDKAMDDWEQQCCRQSLAAFNEIAERLTTRRPEFYRERTKAENKFRGWLKKSNVSEG